MNITKTILFTCQQLENHSSTPRLDAELLIAYSCQKNRSYLYSHNDQELSPQQEQALQQYIKRRQSGEPLAYILGEQEFWSLAFKVTKETLIPRPETEHLVEWILDHFSAEETIRLADLGTGCGAIAIALASERRQWKIDATDQSTAALEIAQFNANKLQKAVRFFSGYWCEALPIHDYHILVSNPPYLGSNDLHLDHLTYEPKHALVAEKNGLEAFEIIAHQAKHYLVSSGYLIFEHGYTQADQVNHILQQAGFIHIEQHKDLAGLPRFITAQYF